MKEYIITERDAIIIKILIKFLIGSIIALNINNYNLVIFLLMIMTFI